MVELVTVSVPPFSMPPPKRPRCSVVGDGGVGDRRVPPFSMPPPSAAEPPEMVRPAMEAVTPLDDRENQDGTAAADCYDFAPGPSITSGPAVSEAPACRPA